MVKYIHAIDLKSLSVKTLVETKVAIQLNIIWFESERPI